jgi:hypothetical protein
MLEDYSGVIIGVAVAAVACIVFYFVSKRTKAPSESESFLPEQTRESSKSLPVSRESIPSAQPTQPLPRHTSGNSELVSRLRQNLRLKVLYDEAKIDRLIDYERKYSPNGSEAELMQAAIDRWEHDNR